MLLTRLLTNRVVLWAIYLPWILLPHPLRKRVTTAGIWVLLLLKRAVGIERQVTLTPPGKIFTLSFWGVPRVALHSYSLTVDGRVKHPLSLSLDDLRCLPATERQVTLDCVGGLRNVLVMRGVSLARVLERSEPEPDAKTIVFHCADGYFTTHPLKDLIETDAFLAYEVNGQKTPAYGHPLRLVAPGKYGYKWAKWVARMELATGSPKGYWEQRGLPDGAWVGDIH